MFTLTSSQQFLLYNQPCDMRKSFDALAGLVRGELQRDPLSGEVFLFLNRRRSHLKLLHWENGGLVLYYKRLERGTFAPPSATDMSQPLSQPLSWTQLVLLVEGISMTGYTQKRRWKCG